MSEISDTTLAPVPGGDTAPVRLTGTSSQANATAFPTGSFCTLINTMRIAIRFRMGPTTPTAVTTDPCLAPGARYDWKVQTDSIFVACVADDGTSTFEAHVWRSSGPA